MNKPNARKWVEALRSGKYKQTRRALRDKDGYCCLGIVCKLSGIRAILDKKHPTQYLFNGNSGVLPERAQKWLGLDGGNPRIGKIVAAELNDLHRMSFGQIADEIEKHWLSA